jgi:hypothetical protein
MTKLRITPREFILPAIEEAFGASCAMLLGGLRILELERLRGLARQEQAIERHVLLKLTLLHNSS